MKTQYSIQDLAGELHRRVEHAEDYIADTRRLGFFVSGKEAEGPKVALTLDSAANDTLFAVNDHAQNQIATRLNLPMKFWDRMRDNHHDILQDTVTKLFMREPESRMIRTIGDTARAFLSNRYRRLDNYDLMEQSIIPGLAEANGGEIFSLGLTDTRMYVKVVFPEIKIAVKDDDEMSPGIAISNSEVGAGSLTVEPFLFRWLCTNGCIMGKKEFSDFGMRKQHVGKRIEDSDVARRIFTDDTMKLDDAAFFAMAKDLIAHAVTGIEFEAIVSQMRGLTEIEVGGDPVLAVERLAKAHTLNETEQASVMSHLIKGGDLTAWGYMNAVTRTAEDVESYDRATELERLGGELIALPAKQWKALAAA